MTAETDMHDRIDRARSEDMKAIIVSGAILDGDESTLVVEVENHDSDAERDSIHTVLPHELYCSCWDHRARVDLCKHLIFLALGEDDSVTDEMQTAVRMAVTDELKDMQDEEVALRAQLREIADRRERMETVREAMGMRDYGLDSDDSDDGSEDEYAMDRDELEALADDLTNGV